MNGNMLVYSAPLPIAICLFCRIASPHVRPIFFGLGAVEPECIPSLRKQLADQIVPIEIAGFRIRRVVNMGIRHVQVLLVISANSETSNQTSPKPKAWHGHVHRGVVSVRQEHQGNSN